MAALTIVVCCKPASDSDSSASVDTLMYETDTLEVAPDEFAADEGSVQASTKIGYYWQDAWSEQERFRPMTKLYDEVRRAISLRDSVFYLREGKFSAEDSAIFQSDVDRAYQSILKYASDMRVGTKLTKQKGPQRPPEVITEEDESYKSLRESSSEALPGIDYMFVGGAPFVNMDPDIHKDKNGNPLLYYTIQVPENADFFFDYIYSRQNSPVTLSYGPPLNSYEGTDTEVHGIGSITHTFDDPLSVYFLTRNGAEPAKLISVNVKLGDERGCISNNPTFTFATPNNISQESIFGVIASDNFSIKNAFMSESDEGYWQYDVDGDNVIDIVRMVSTYEGASGDLLAAIWYIRTINGWRVLDYGSEPDCT